MIFCIDGTGEQDPQKYFNDMKRGFCYHIAQQYKGSVYRRGPEKFGTETWSIGTEILAKILNAKLAYAPNAPKLTMPTTRSIAAAIAKKHIIVNDVPITLVGHSRGGAACIYVAYRLQEMNIKVNAMLLFDAVDRALGFDTTTIPANVQKCLHLIRDPQFADYFHNTQEYKDLMSRYVPEYLDDSFVATGPGTTLNQRLAVKTPNPQWLRLKKLEQLHVTMRDMCRVDCLVFGMPVGFSFGNAGTKWYAGKTDYRSVKFMATHGAMGGAPLHTSKQIDDQRYWGLVAEAEVWAMFQVQARAKDFLAEVKENGDLKLDYLPMCTTWDQTAF